MIEEQETQLKTNPPLPGFQDPRKKMDGDPYRPLHHYVSPGGRLSVPSGSVSGRWRISIDNRVPRCCLRRLGKLKLSNLPMPRHFSIIASAFLCTVLIGCQSGGGARWPDIEPPLAEVAPTEFEAHGHVRVDNYCWMRNRENPEVIAHLKAENAYAEAMMEHTGPLQQKLAEEFRERIKQSDVSVPYQQNGYYYYARTEEGKQYPVYYRKKGSLDTPEEVVLDHNEVAGDNPYCFLFRREVSSDNKVLAYSVDYVGRRKFEIRFRNLVTNKELPDVISEVTGSMAWANDGRTLFYSRQDPETLRWHQLWRHEVGTDPVRDVLVYDEKDKHYYCLLRKTSSGEYITFTSVHTLNTEVRYLDANHPKDELRVFDPKRPGHIYRVNHAGDHFYIRTNDNAANFRLMKTPEDKTGMENWTEVVPHSEDALLEGVDGFGDHLLVRERKAGVPLLRVRELSTGDEHYIDFGEPAYDAELAPGGDFESARCRVSYSSFTTPPSVYEVDLNTQEKKLLKQEEMGRGFDRSHYTTERVCAKARDGVRVPISLVYRRDAFRGNGTNPILLYGYGAYGLNLPVAFDAYRISLLDRGFVYAFAHVRGGQEMGRAWYEDGKLLNKKNTFTDFIDAAGFLIQERYADPKRIFITSGSAGGLLIGAVANMRPDLWKGVIAAMPFVDLVSAMLDETLPASTMEYDEWGDPREKKYYDYMVSYSPYDNVRPCRHPNVLVTAALEDSQVPYWEPAKWAAKLRATNTGDNVILLKTNMEGSHGGVSGRYDRYRDVAFRYAFLLELAGIHE